VGCAEGANHSISQILEIINETTSINTSNNLYLPNRILSLPYQPFLKPAMSVVDWHKYPFDVYIGRYVSNGPPGIGLALVGYAILFLDYTQC
jgi:hypothetical protein